MLVTKNKITIYLTIPLLVLIVLTLCGCKSSYNDPGKTMSTSKASLSQAQLKPIGGSISVSGLSDTPSDHVANVEISLNRVSIFDHVPEQVSDIERFNEGVQEMKERGYKLPDETGRSETEGMSYLVLDYNIKNLSDQEVSLTPGFFTLLKSDENSSLDSIGAPGEALYTSDDHESSRYRLALDLAPHEIRDWQCVGLIPKHAFEQGPVYLIIENQGGGPDGISGMKGFTLTKEECEFHE